jgi:hypothetical protein
MAMTPVENHPSPIGSQPLIAHATTDAQKKLRGAYPNVPPSFEFFYRIPQI